MYNLLKAGKNGLTDAFPEVQQGPNSDGEMTVISDKGPIRRTDDALTNINPHFHFRAHWEEDYAGQF